MINDIGWRNHGTAVLGEMISQPNSKGTVGISHQAKAVVHSAIINEAYVTPQVSLPSLPDSPPPRRS